MSLNAIVGVLLKLVNLGIPLHYFPMMYVQSIIAGVIISVIAVIAPAISSSKLNIVEAIKYE